MKTLPTSEACAAKTNLLKSFVIPKEGFVDRVWHGMTLTTSNMAYMTLTRTKIFKDRFCGM